MRYMADRDESHTHPAEGTASAEKPEQMASPLESDHTAGRPPPQPLAAEHGATTVPVDDVAAGTIVFDPDRFWCKDAPCLEAGERVHPVVTLACVGVISLNECWDRLQWDASVEADAYVSDSHFTVELWFRSIAPLIGPMTYREVECAVEHYLGWCSASGSSMPAWKTKVAHKTIALVRPQWFELARRQSLSKIRPCVKQVVRATRGFRCRTPCRGKAEDG